MIRNVLVIILGTIPQAFQALAAPPDFTNVIRYTAPTNFFGGVASEARSDPGDNPMALGGLQILDFKERYDYRHPSEIIFNLGLVCAYLGPGKVLHFLPATPALMKSDMEAEYTGKFPNSTSVSIEKINGLNAVCLTASRPPEAVQPYFLHFCWVQIETNIVLKITAVSSDINIFQRETNSIQSLEIDKSSLLRMLGSPSKQDGSQPPK